MIEEFLGEWPEYKSDTRVSPRIQNSRNPQECVRPRLHGSRRPARIRPERENAEAHQGHTAAIGRLTVGNPNFALLLPCLHEPFVVSFYEGIKTIDFACFMKVAKQLRVDSYAGTLDDLTGR